MPLLSTTPFTRRTYVATADLVIPRSLILEISLPKHCTCAAEVIESVAAVA